MQKTKKTYTIERAIPPQASFLAGFGLTEPNSLTDRDFDAAAREGIRQLLGTKLPRTLSGNYAAYSGYGPSFGKIFFPDGLPTRTQEEIDAGIAKIVAGITIKPAKTTGAGNQPDNLHHETGHLLDGNHDWYSPESSIVGTHGVHVPPAHPNLLIDASAYMPKPGGDHADIEGIKGFLTGVLKEEWQTGLPAHTARVKVTRTEQPPVVEFTAKQAAANWEKAVKESNESGEFIGLPVEFKAVEILAPKETKEPPTQVIDLSGLSPEEFYALAKANAGDPKILEAIARCENAPRPLLASLIQSKDKNVRDAAMENRNTPLFQRIAQNKHHKG